MENRKKRRGIRKSRNPSDFIAFFRTLIEDIFSPVFNREEIPEILFNPKNAQLREDRINEYVYSLPDEELKGILVSALKSIVKSSIYDKVMLFLALSHESYSVDLDYFERNKVRIFGEEIKGVSLEDECFKGLLEKKAEK